MYFNMRDMYAADRPKRIKGVEVVDLFEFKDLSILTVVVSIVGIKYHRLLMTTKDLHPKLDIYCVPTLLILGSLEEVVHLLDIIDVAMDFLPPRLIHKVIVY